MTHSKPASRGDRERFPDVEERIGEDPARVLDRPLIKPTRSKTSSPFALAEARIRGIDRLGVLNGYLQVERSLDRGPRDQVVELLEQRRDLLLELGDRDDRDVGPRDPAPEKDVVIIDEDGNPEPYEKARKGTASAKVQSVRDGFETNRQVRADGGDPDG